MCFRKGKKVLFKWHSQLFEEVVFLMGHIAALLMEEEARFLSSVMKNLKLKD